MAPLGAALLFLCAPTPAPHTHPPPPSNPLNPVHSFGGVSPEQKGADHLRALFTFVAARVILAQLEGSGRGALASYNAPARAAIARALEADGGAALLSRDPDAWLEKLLAADPAAARRVIEVRDAYASEAFEWDQLKRLALRDTRAANLRLMRKAAAASLNAAAGGAAAAASEGGDGASGGDGAGEEGAEP